VEAHLATGDHPHASELLGEGDTVAAFGRMFAVMFEERGFERRLARLLDGIAREIERGDG
jgi:hypothetical protein